MVKVRIAPSPTGNLHIGTARTAFFNWLFAKKMGGEFILRIEDTDLERSDKKYEEDIMEGLKWLGLDWSNSPPSHKASEGHGVIYRQSERLDTYERYLKTLFDSGAAFWCDHSKEELEIEQKEQSARKEAPRHLCSHKSERRNKGQIIRLAVDENSDKKVVFEDKIRGKIKFEEKLLGDFSLAKDLRTPLYNFAAVVDDIEMNITHVIRGEDHISNTPKQILIYKALGKEPPIFAHLPLILGSDKSKLSKRHGATSVIEYKKDYLPEAMINFMGFLGYTYTKDILTIDEMAQEFALSKVHKSGAIFDAKKLNWINSQYIKKLLPEEFKKLADVPELPDEAVSLVTERLEKLSDVQNFDYFWKAPVYDRELLKWKDFSLEESKKTLEKVRQVLLKSDFNDKGEIRKNLDELAQEVGDPVKSPLGDHGANRGLVYWPLRVALTGKEKSPDPVDVAFVLGKEKTLKRVTEAIEN